jgi:hypothetical protein
LQIGPLNVNATSLVEIAFRLRESVDVRNK